METLKSHAICDQRDPTMSEKTNVSQEREQGVRKGRRHGFIKKNEIKERRKGTAGRGDMGRITWPMTLITWLSSELPRETPQVRASQVPREWRHKSSWRIIVGTSEAKTSREEEGTAEPKPVPSSPCPGWVALSISPR